MQPTTIPTARVLMHLGPALEPNTTTPGALMHGDALWTAWMRMVVLLHNVLVLSLSKRCSHTPERIRFYSVPRQCS